MSPKKGLFILSFIISFVLIAGTAVIFAVCNEMGMDSMKTVYIIGGIIIFIGVLFLINGILEYRSYCLKNKANLESSQSAVAQILNNMETLSFKASSLKSSNEELYLQVQGLMSIVKQIKPLNDITAAKFEQDIFCKITAVSSLCDGVIAGNDGAELKKQLSSLEILLKQRAAMGN